MQAHECKKRSAVSLDIVLIQRREMLESIIELNKKNGRPYDGHPNLLIDLERFTAVLEYFLRNTRDCRRYRLPWWDR
jgi:hypothetical protein